MENENYWLLDFDDPAYDKTLSRISSPECESTAYESSFEDYSHRSYYVKSESTLTDTGSLDINTPFFSEELDDVSLDSYLKSISDLNREIEEFSKIVQTLALFKYYIKNRKNTTNINELNKRFNSICINCSNKIKCIEDKLKRINYDNHYVMVQRKKLGFSYFDLRNRFNMQDASVKKLKILIDTFNTVIKEYTTISKKIISSGTNSPTGINNRQVDPNMDKKLLSEINNRTKDIEILEQNAKDLNELFIELNNIIKKRGDNISNLENQILLSSEQIDLEEYCKTNFLDNHQVPETVKALFHKTNEEYTEWYEPLKEAFEILKQTDEGKKVNFIGQYSYEPLQKVNKVLKNFHKHNLHIVSYYQLLHKYVTYYVPYLKKSVTRTTTELNDYKLKESESVKKFKNFSNELENKLKGYGLDVTEYPFKDEHQSQLYFSLQEKIVESAVKYMKETYKESVELLKKLHEPLTSLLNSYSKYQKMEENYSVEDSTKFLKHGALHGLEPYYLASSLHESISNYTANTSTNLSNDVIVIDDRVKLDESSEEMLFNSFLGNNMCRKFLLSDLYELLIFVSLREEEIRKVSSLPNYNILDNMDQEDPNLRLTLKDYEGYKTDLNKVIELLTGSKTVNMQNLLKNQQKLSETVQSEMSLWVQGLNELNKQSSYQYQIKSLETNLNNLKNELETVKKNTTDIKNKLEEQVSSISKMNVHIFGEIDQL